NKVVNVNNNKTIAIKISPNCGCNVFIALCTYCGPGSTPGSAVLYNAKSCQMMIGSNTVNYIEFGSGKKTLIILPGLGDGLFPLHG
ncbi:hypothetical protein ACTPEM_24910, partial [Clostridioides difficile]